MSKLLESSKRHFQDLVLEIRWTSLEFKREIAMKQAIQAFLQLLYNQKLVASFPEFQRLLTLFAAIQLIVLIDDRSRAQKTELFHTVVISKKINKMSSQKQKSPEWAWFFMTTPTFDLCKYETSAHTTHQCGTNYKRFTLIEMNRLI